MPRSGCMGLAWGESQLKKKKKKKKRTKDKEDKDILTKFTTMAPVHSCVSRGNKITLSLTDKVKLLFVSIRKILNKSMDFYPTLSVLQHFSMAIIITSLKIYST